MKKAVVVVESHSMSNSTAHLEQDPFALFQIDASYVLPIAAIEKKYIELQQLYHPDRFVKASPEDQLKAQQLASDINEAYAQLMDPVKRGICLLNRVGVECDVQENHTISDPELLMEIMELREALSEINNDEDRQNFQKNLQLKIENCEESIQASFQDKNYDLSKSYVTKLQYYYKTKKELKLIK